MSQKAFRLTAMTLAAAAVLATSAAPGLAQTQPVPGQSFIKRDPHFNRSAGGYATHRANLSRQTHDGDYVGYGFGRLEEQTRATRRLVSEVAPKFKDAVSATLPNPDGAQCRDLRLGMYRSALVICGTVHVDDGAGGREARRFIARSSVATLETEANQEAFQQGLRQTGCNS
jgi:hypothetical protein